MRDLVTGATVALFIRATGVLASLGLTLLVARSVGAEGAGAFFLALAVLTLGSAVGRLGLDVAVMKEVASARTAPRAWLTARVGLKLIGVISLVVAGCTVTVVTIAAAFLSPRPVTMAVSVLWAAVAIVPHALSFGYAEVLKAYGRFGQATFVQSLAVPGAALLGLLVIGAVKTDLRALNIVQVYVSGTLLSVIVARRLYIRSAGQATSATAFEPSAHKEVSAALVSAGLPIFVVTVTSLALGATDILLLGILASPQDVGLYSVGARVAALMGFPLVAVNTVLAPKMAQQFASGAKESLEALVRYAAGILTVATFPLLAACLLFPGQILGFFGPEFESGTAVLMFLAAGQFVNAGTGAVMYLLLMTGQEQVMRNIAVAAAAFNLCANAVGIMAMGAVGAAVATSITMILLNLAAAFMVVVRLGIAPLPVVMRPRAVGMNSGPQPQRGLKTAATAEEGQS